VFGGFSAKTLSDRIYDAGARIVVTADGGYRNAEVVPYKEKFTDPALDNFVPRPVALETLATTLAAFDLGPAAVRLLDAVTRALQGEITLERSDVMRELGRALSEETAIAPKRTAEIRTAVARQLAATGHLVKQVLVVRYTGQDIVQHDRDVWSHQRVETALEAVLSRARDAGLDVRSRDELSNLGDTDFWRALCASHPAVPVDSDTPLFIIYTSGSTGKPKGVVHTHGGWLSGISHTLRMVFDADREDRIYVIADPGWITGQSYVITALRNVEPALKTVARCRSMIDEK
ncbi:MAG: AMP-binding protein, partial [Myxococcota bacterium]